MGLAYIIWICWKHNKIIPICWKPKDKLKKKEEANRVEIIKPDDEPELKKDPELFKKLKAQSFMKERKQVVEDISEDDEIKE